MNRIQTAAGVFLACSLLAWAAENTFEDPRGRFALDLPAGWTLEPQKSGAPDVYAFKSQGESLMVFVESQAADSAQLFAIAEKRLKDAMPGAAPEKNMRELEVNGQPARWAVYRSRFEAAGGKMTLLCLVGSVLFDKGGVYFIAVLNPDSRKKWEKKLEKVFQSLRPAAS